MPPSHHSWQKNRNLIERDKIPLLLPQREIRVVSVSEPWRHARSSLFTNSSGERHRKWDRETDRKVKTLSGIHCDSFLIVGPTFPAPTVYITAVLPIVESSHFRRKWDSLCHKDWWSPLTSATEALSPFQNSNQAFLSLLFEGLSYLMFKCCWLWTCPVRVLIGRRISWATWGGSFPSSMLKVHSTGVSQGQIG